MPHQAQNSTEPHNRMVSSTFPAMLCLQSLTAPPQRVSQVNAWVSIVSLHYLTKDRRLCYTINILYFTTIVNQKDNLK
jgi:hypothetical protein